MKLNLIAVFMMSIYVIRNKCCVVLDLSFLFREKVL